MPYDIKMPGQVKAIYVEGFYKAEFHIVFYADKGHYRYPQPLAYSLFYGVNAVEPGDNLYGGGVNTMLYEYLFKFLPCT
jgi:hypothetical protein